MEQSTEKNGIALVDVISTAIQIPGIKIDRDVFLRDTFKNKSPEEITSIIELGPVKAKCSKSELEEIAHKIINERTLFSTGASFLAGLPGGIAMAATIPGDIIQFYSVALRMAQELAYLYGEPNLWEGGQLSSEKVTNQLILYCGVMLGSSGAAQTVRILSSSLAKQAMQKLPQQALTKTFYYPIIKSIAKSFGAKMTKEAFAKGVSKAIPIIGGVISGGITFATMSPMGMRLFNALEEAHFAYSASAFEADWEEVVEMYDEEIEPEDVSVSDADPVADNISVSVLTEINQAKQMLDSGIIYNEEFAEIKTKLISKL